MEENFYAMFIDKFSVVKVGYGRTGYTKNIFVI